MEKKILRVMSETYFKFLNLIDWEDKNYLNGINEGLNKFLSNLYLSLFKKKNKYFNTEFISLSALEKLNNKDYSNLVFEHVVPKQKFIQKICEEKARNHELTIGLVYDLISKYWVICTITKDEDKLLNRTNMPSNWNEKNLFARYDEIGLKIVKNPYFNPSLTVK